MKSRSPKRFQGAKCHRRKCHQQNNQNHTANYRHPRQNSGGQKTDCVSKGDTWPMAPPPSASSTSVKCSWDTSSTSTVEKKVESQSFQEKRDLMVERLRIYNQMLNFHKSIKEDQVYLYRKLQEMDELYLRNTQAILRLGFCPCVVHQQTSPVGDRLMKIHKKLRMWDRKVEELCEFVKEPSTKKSASAVLEVLNICCDDSRLEAEAVGDFQDVVLPNIVWDLGNPFIEQLDLLSLHEEWRTLRGEVRQSLRKAEIIFDGVCLEYGVRRAPPELYWRNGPFLSPPSRGMDEEDISKVDSVASDGKSSASTNQSSTF